MLNILFLKLLDKTVGRLLCTIFPPSSVNAPDLISKILIIRPGGIGDAVLLIPTVTTIRSAYPACSIDILAEKRNAAVFRLVSGIRNVYLYDSLTGILSALQNRYDAVIDSEQWHRLSAVTARMVRAPVKIGFGTNERSRLFSHHVQYFPDDYEADSFLKLLIPLSVDVSQGIPSYFIRIPEVAMLTAASLMERVGEGPVVAIFPGSSSMEKRWGADCFRQVAEQLSVFGSRIVVVGGEDDRRQGDFIAGGGLGLNLAGLTSLSETAAVIQNSALLVSGDSGVLHIAAGLGVPTVSLFGPGRTEKWAPRGDRHIVLNKELPCSPCTTFGNTPPCPIGARCMQDITVDEVVNAAITLLTRVKPVQVSTDFPKSIL